jgi:hypothetical protein
MAQLMLDRSMADVEAQAKEEEAHAGVWRP